jgi:hypothetical protein
MIINWKQDCLKIVPTKSGSAKTLLPGMNEMSDADWGFAKASLALELKLGHIEEVIMTTQTGPGKPSKEAKGIFEIPAAKAKSLISETNSGETLNTWLAKETRSDVRRYIEDRLETLGIDKKEIVEAEEEVIYDEVVSDDDAPAKGKK